MKKYYKKSTVLIVQRELTNTGDYENNAFETTYGEALRNDELCTNQGTMRVFIELHPSEYINFEGCSTVIRYDEDTPYLEYTPEDERVHGTFYENGAAAEYSALDR